MFDRFAKQSVIIHINTKMCNSVLANT